MIVCSGIMLGSVTGKETTTPIRGRIPGGLAVSPIGKCHRVRIKINKVQLFTAMSIVTRIACDPFCDMLIMKVIRPFSKVGCAGSTTAHVDRIVMANKAEFTACWYLSIHRSVIG